MIPRGLRLLALARVNADARVQPRDLGLRARGHARGAERGVGRRARHEVDELHQASARAQPIMGEGQTEPAAPAGDERDAAVSHLQDFVDRDSRGVSCLSFC